MQKTILDFTAKTDLNIEVLGPINTGTKNKPRYKYLGDPGETLNGKSPHKGGDSVNSYKVKIVDGKLYVNLFPSNIGKKVYKPHTATQS